MEQSLYGYYKRAWIVKKIQELKFIYSSYPNDSYSRVHAETTIFTLQFMKLAKDMGFKPLEKELTKFYEAIKSKFKDKDELLTLRARYMNKFEKHILELVGFTVEIEDLTKEMLIDKTTAALIDIIVLIDDYLKVLRTKNYGSERMANNLLCEAIGKYHFM